VYADPKYSTYEALRFVSGVSTTFTPVAGLKIIQAYMEGYRQDWGLSFEKDTRTKGGWQQGGIIVAGPGISNISYIHKARALRSVSSAAVFNGEMCSKERMFLYTIYLHLWNENMEGNVVIVTGASSGIGSYPAAAAKIWAIFYKVVTKLFTV
ncbi:hypothetical protein RJ639_022858, partial [Escallonia herrerae]